MALRDPDRPSAQYRKSKCAPRKISRNSRVNSGSFLCALTPGATSFPRRCLVVPANLGAEYCLVAASRIGHGSERARRRSGLTFEPVMRGRPHGEVDPVEQMSGSVDGVRTLSGRPVSPCSRSHSAVRARYVNPETLRYGFSSTGVT